MTPLTFYPGQDKTPRKRPVRIGAPPHIIREMREEQEDHLTSINQNTDEIHANFEGILQNTQKVDKLSEQIMELMEENNRLKKEMQLQLSAKSTDNPSIEPLTTREQEVFLVLYTEEDFISQSEIGRRLQLPMTLVRQFLTSLMEKGVSITRKGKGNEILLKLDQDFKEKQAKDNIAGIGEQLTLTLATTGTL